MLLESRIAEGRPPPDVWRKAQEWRVTHAKPDGWYPWATPGPESAADPGPGVPSVREARNPVRVSDPLVLRLVQLPLAGGAGPATGSRFAPWTLTATAD